MAITLEELRKQVADQNSVSSATNGDKITLSELRKQVGTSVPTVNVPEATIKSRQEAQVINQEKLEQPKPNNKSLSGLPYYIENQGLYFAPDEKSVLADVAGAFGKGVIEGVKGFGRSIANTGDVIKSVVTPAGELNRQLEETYYDPAKAGQVKQITENVLNQYGVDSEYNKNIRENITQRNQKQSESIAELYQKYADVPYSDTAINVGQGVGNLLPSIIANAATGGAFGSSLFGAGVFGGAMGEALASGATQDQALLYAAADTALEVGVEKLFGGIPFLGEGKISAKGLTQKYVKSAAGQLLVNRLADITGEGVEEVASGIIEPFLKRAFYDKSATNASLKDLLSDFGNGALVSAVLGVANFGGNIAEYNDIKKNIENQKTKTISLPNPVDAGINQSASNEQKSFDLNKLTTDKLLNNPQAGINQPAENTSNPFDTSKLPKAKNTETNKKALNSKDSENKVIAPAVQEEQSVTRKSGFSDFVSSLDGVRKTNAESALTRKHNSGVTNAEYIESNVDGEFIAKTPVGKKSTLYYLRKDGKDYPITKTMHEYGKFLQYNSSESVQSVKDEILHTVTIEDIGGNANAGIGTQNTGYTMDVADYFKLKRNSVGTDKYTYTDKFKEYLATFKNPSSVEKVLTTERPLARMSKAIEIEKAVDLGGNVGEIQGTPYLFYKGTDGRFYNLELNKTGLKYAQWLIENKNNFSETNGFTASDELLKMINNIKSHAEKNKGGIVSVELDDTGKVQVTWKGATGVHYTTIDSSSGRYSNQKTDGNIIKDITSELLAFNDSSNVVDDSSRYKQEPYNPDKELEQSTLEGGFEVDVNEVKIANDKAYKHDDELMREYMDYIDEDEEGLEYYISADFIDVLNEIAEYSALQVEMPQDDLTLIEGLDDEVDYIVDDREYLLTANSVKSIIDYWEGLKNTFLSKEYRAEIDNVIKEYKEEWLPVSEKAERLISEQKAKIKEASDTKPDVKSEVEQAETSKNTPAKNTKKSKSTSSQNGKAVLNSLQNQEAAKIIKAAKKNDKLFYANTDDSVFIGSGAIAYLVDGNISSDDIDIIKSAGYSIIENERFLDHIKIKSNETFEINMLPKETTIKNKKAYIFDVGNGIYTAFNKKYFDSLNKNGNKFVTEFTPRDNLLLTPLKAVDVNGNFAGIVLPLRVEDVVSKYAEATNVKESFFSKPKKVAKKQQNSKTGLVTIDGVKEIGKTDKGIVILESIPEGWKKIHIQSAPIGYVGISNGKSLFDKEHKIAVVPEHLISIDKSTKMEDNVNGKKYAHPSLKKYADDINNGRTVPIKFIENLPEIIDADKRAYFDKSTFELYPIGQNAERDSLRENIKDFLLSDKNGAAVFENGKLKKQNGEGVYTGKVKQERIADIVIGPPAAGKSTVFADRLSFEHSARIIDSDIAKSMLPEFDNGYGASKVQTESAYIVEELALSGAIESGDNIVLPKVGKTFDSLREFIEILKDEGYTVNLYYNELPTEKAINRAFARFITTGRYLPVGYLKSVKASDIENTYQKLKESGLIDYYEWKNNDVRFGEEPKLKERGYNEHRRNKTEAHSEIDRFRSNEFRSRTEKKDSGPQSKSKSQGINDTSDDVSISLSEIKSPYYTINEATAKTAKMMMSHDDYIEGSATARYKAKVDELIEVAEEKKKQYPEHSNEIDRIVDRYAKLYADYINKDNSISAQYPSVMVSGAGNFNNKKKQKQIDRWDKNFEFHRDKIEPLERKIRNFEPSTAIKSDDADAVSKLQKKLENLKSNHQLMKDANAYWKKNKTLKGFDGLTKELSEKINFMYSEDGNIAPFSGYPLQGSNAEIKRIEERIKNLESIAAAEGSATENDFYRLTKDNEANRIRFYFDGKPDNEVVDVLKKNGFKWAPSVGAWQRQTTGNAIKATEKIKIFLDKHFDVSNDLPGGMGAMSSSYYAAIDKYGSHPVGENPFNPVDVPASIDGETRVARGTRTLMEAEATHNIALSAFEKAVGSGEFNYDIIHDKDSVKKAVDYIEKYGWQKTFDNWKDKIDNHKEITKDDMVSAQIMYAAAMDVEDYDTALEIATDIALQATKAGQVVQSMRVLKKTTPEGRLYFAKKSVDAIQDDINEKYGDKAPKLDVPQELLENIKNARTEEEISKATEAMHLHIAEQLPFSWSNFITSWRYLAMLGNTRTQVRNVVSNTVGILAQEYTNFVQSGIESAIEKSGKKIQRTSAVKTNEWQRQMAETDFEAVKDTLFGEKKYNNDTLKGIQRKQNPFDLKGKGGKAGEVAGKILTKWNNATNWAMDEGDKLFSGPAYKRAYARYLAANKVTSEQQLTSKMKMRARAWATKQSLESVYRENNELAQWISRQESNLLQSSNVIKRAGAKIVGGLMPFRGTPLNITKRAFEYTPVGIAIELINNKTSNPTEVINKAAKSLSGTSLIVLGYALAKCGILTGGLGDDKEDKMKDQMGRQSYSINVGNISYTLDWGGAAVMPLFVGAQMYDQTTEDSDNFFMAMLDTFANASAPIMETSMMTGLMDALASANYEDNPAEKITAFISSGLASYLGQFVPTLLGQVARAVDDTSRSSYTNVKGVLKPLAKTMQKAENKIPFLSKTNVPYMDVWGNDVKNAGGNVLGRLAYNMLSPGYAEKKSTDKVETMLTELYEKTGDTSVLPSNYTTHKRMGDETIRFTDKQYEAYTKAYGQTAYSLLKDISADSSYKSLEDAYRVEIVDKIYDYSNAIASNKVVGKELSNRQVNQQKALKRGISANYVFGGLIEADANENGTLSKAEVEAFVNRASGLSRLEKAYLFDALGNSNWKNPYA